MSGVLKGLKKAFKKVGKFVKKIALPALAIGAVLLTGGAALGVFGAAGLSGTLASIGLSPALTGILATAAKGATMGAITSGLTGGDIIKGATTGFVVGGVAGGLGAAGGLGSKAATSVASGGNGVTGFATPAERAISTGANLMNTGGNVVASAAPAAVAAGGGGLGSGVLSFLNSNPTVTGSMVQGIGGGLMAGAQAKESRRADEAEAASYSDTSQLFRTSRDPARTNEPSGGEDSMRSPIPYADASFVYDRNTGTVRLVKGA